MLAAFAVLVLIGAAALDWYSHVLAGMNSGGPVPLQSIAPRAPTATIAPRPTSLPPAVKQTSVPTSGPTVPASTATPAAAVPRQPKIISISLSSSVVTGGQIVTGTVRTTTDVVAVKARIAAYSSLLTKVGAGHFALSYRVPKLPFFLHRTYTIEVTASNARGESDSSSLPITVR